MPTRPRSSAYLLETPGQQEDPGRLECDLYYDARGRNRDQPFILGSSGDDGIMVNEDDINIWTMDGPAPAGWKLSDWN